MSQLRNTILISIIVSVLTAFGTTVVLLSNPNLLSKITSEQSPTRDVLENIIPTDSLGQSADSYEATVIKAVQSANPAVVSVVITKDVPVVEQYFEESPFDDFFGNDFFSPFRFRAPQLRERGTQRQEIGGGSGFLITADGMIVTNRHVVAQEDAEYTVFTDDGTKYTATIVARDPVNDIAVLKIDGTNLPFLEFGDSEQLQVGQTVIAIGNALSEFRNTVSVGVVSGLSRSIQASDGLGQSEQLEEVIQTDAAINPGNSGGPLLDLHGKVVGVNVAVARGSENIGFALPASLVTSILETVKETGTIVRPYLGVRYIPITPALKERNHLSVDYGVLVNRGETPEDLAVLPGSPADKAGLQEGDIILEADGTKLDENASLASLVRKKKVGDTMTLKVLHKGQEKTIAVKLEEMPQ